MPLRTKLTEKLGIRHPILLAPMGTASGGTLAKAVTEGGGLGIIGFGYGNQERIDQEFRAAGELMGLSENLIFNCTGLGARTLLTIRS